MRKLMIDPPSGWMYGFPCELKEGKSVEELLREHKYPEKDILFALQNMRLWIKTEEQV
jgi:hypothetical protein